MGEKHKHHEHGAPAFPTIYSQFSPFEDVAETMNLWINHNASLKKLAATNPAIQQRVDFVQRIFGDRYIFDDLDTAYLLDQEDERFCDSTTAASNIISIAGLQDLNEAYRRCRFAK